jgi:hypothetical protein
MKPLSSVDTGCIVSVPRRRLSSNPSREVHVIAALTVRKLKPGTYEEWRKAWQGDDEDMPEGAEIFILRNMKDQDEIIAFGLVEGNLDEIQASMDPAVEEKRKEAMAPYVESVGADGIYDVIERIPAQTGAKA